MGGADRRAGLDEGELIGMLRKVRQQVGEPCAAFSVLLPGTIRHEELADAALRARLDPLKEGRRRFLPSKLDEIGLVIIKVKRAGGPIHM